MLDAGYWMLDTGYWILDTGCWILDAGCCTEARQDGTVGFLTGPLWEVRIALSC
jgi:hypothetical protein